MKTNQLINAAILITVFILNGQAWSAIIIEPDDFDDRTVLDEVFPGVNLSSTTWNNKPVSIWPVTANIDSSGYAATGIKVFGHSNIGFWNSDRRLRVDFSEPASSISLQAAGSSYFNLKLAGWLETYDTKGNLLETYKTSSLAASEIETMIITRPQKDISFAVAFTVGGNPFGRLDHMEFTIPEPTTFILLGLGVLSLRKHNTKKGPAD